MGINLLIGLKKGSIPFGCSSKVSVVGWIMNRVGLSWLSQEFLYFFIMTKHFFFYGIKYAYFTLSSNNFVLSRHKNCPAAILPQTETSRTFQFLNFRISTYPFCVRCPHTHTKQTSGWSSSSIFSIASSSSSMLQIRMVGLCSVSCYRPQRK